jgi:prepilin-type N-terminal cleavage/methylation domain-containing protein
MNSKERGFSLIELMMAITVLLVVLGGIFSVIDVVNQRSYTEQAKLDMFQEAREFMDQMSRDLHQAGYPSPRHYVGGTVLDISPVTNDKHNAVGIVKVDSGDLWFEGDVDGTGKVSVVRYHLDTSMDNGCPCLRRSQLEKIDADPVDGQTAEDYQVQVTGVQNEDIFSVFARGTTGTPIMPLPINFNDNAADIASADTIKAVLSLRSPNVDLKTKQRPQTTLVLTVKLNNCSQAAINYAMSCEWR